MRRALIIAIPSFIGVTLAGLTGEKLPSTIALTLFLVGVNVAAVRVRVTSKHAPDDDDTALALPMALAWLLVAIGPTHDFVQRSATDATSSIGVQPLIEVMYFSLVGLMAIWILRRLDPGLNRLGVPIAVLAYPTWAALSTFWSFFAPYSLARGIQMVVLGVFAWATAELGASFPKTIETMTRIFLRWFVRITLVAIVLGIAFGPIFVPTGGDNLLRFTWIGAHPNASGLMLAMTIVILLSAPGDTLGMPMPLRVAALAPCAWALYENNSRTALVCLLGGTFVCLVLGARRSPLVRFAVTPYAAAAGVIGAFVMRDELLDYFYRGQDSDAVTSGNGRLSLWSDGYALLRTPFDWLFGLGFGTPRVVFQTPEKYWAKSAHNSFLATLVGLGLIGIVVIAVFLISTLYRVVRSRMADDRHGPVMIGLLAVLIVNANATDTSAEPNIGYATILLCWAIATATIRVKSRPDPTSAEPPSPADAVPSPIPIRAGNR